MGTDEILEKIERHCYQIFIISFFILFVVLVGVSYAILKAEGLSFWYILVVAFAVYAMLVYLIDR